MSTPERRESMREYMRNKRATNPAFVEKERERAREYATKRRAEKPDAVKESNVRAYAKQKAQIAVDPELAGKVRAYRTEKSRKQRAADPKGYTAAKRKLVDRRREQYAEDPALLEADRGRSRITMQRLRDEAKGSMSPEKRREYRLNKEFRHPLAAAVRAANHRGKAKGCAGRLKVKTVESHFAHLLYMCQYCGKSGSRSLDHVLPLSRGGENTLENLQLCCHRCNCSKKNRTLEEWNARPYRKGMF